MEKLISFLLWAFRLVEGRIPENVCRVMCTATIAAVLSRILSEKYGVEVILKLKEETNDTRPNQRNP